jgi:aerobic carbon-monoxide dehydrogenase small subunit
MFARRVYVVTPYSASFIPAGRAIPLPKAWILDFSVYSFNKSRNGPCPAIVKHPLTLKVNGTKRSAEVEPRTLLVYFLRNELGLKGPHIGCDTSNCGACTVLMDERCVKSCTVLAIQAQGKEIVTAEGLSSNGELGFLQQAFTDNHALQCGYCTPGFLMAAQDLLSRNPNPTDEEIRLGISGNLCMCTGYQNIVKAIKAAAAKKGGRGK